MKKRVFNVLFLMSITAAFITGCTSSKNYGMEIHPDNESIVDWDGKNYDYPPKPEWLKQMKNPKSELIRKEFGIDKSYIIKFGIGSGKTEESAKLASRINYNAIRAEELRTAVVSEGSKMTDIDAVGNAAIKAPAELTGHELVTQFWQEIETYDEENDVKSRQFICYSIYKISEENWKKTLKTYFKEVMARIPDSVAQNELAELLPIVYEKTTTEKSDEEFVEDVQAKINAIESGTKNDASPVPYKNDIEWLKILETACDIIF